MKAEGIVSGGSVRVRSENGEAVFFCKEGKVPEGMIFVPYGPPTCRLMGQYTDGTGMPTSKGWEVEIEPSRRGSRRGGPRLNAFGPDVRETVLHDNHRSFLKANRK